MRKVFCVAFSGFVFVLSFVYVPPTTAVPSQKMNHGGKIDASYDGFSHETVINLQKMQISCDGVKGRFSETCVSMIVSLHCRGVQAYHVNYVTLQLVFESKAWDQRHALDQRQLSVVVNNETLRLGQMKLISQKTTSKMVETLGITVPYETFKKMAEAQFVEMEVGPSRFLLRNKNLQALRDLNSRVVVAK